MRYNPFNPQQPARPDFFVGRTPEIIEFEKFLSQTMHNSPMNMSITGNRGMGKTSILMKFEEIARNNKCLVLRLSNYEGNVNNMVNFTDYISSNLRREILSKKPITKKIKEMQEWIKTFKPTIGWNDLSLSLEKQQLVQEMLRDRLVQLWKEMKEDYQACVLLIDEAESLERIKSALTFLREVFQRTSQDANYMVVLAGKLNFPERMSESFSPLNRFFPCSKLSPLKNDEIKEYAKKKLLPENVEIDDDALEFICNKSEGHPYVLVAMCYLLFDSLNDNEQYITIQVIDRSEEKVYHKLSQDFFSPMYHPITPKAKEVLLAIAKNANNLSFNFKQAVEWSGMQRNQVSPYIKELLRKGVLNKPERGNYQIFHTLFLNYLKNIHN